MDFAKTHTAHMTHPEYVAALAEDPVFFVPMGSLENQGPQSIMGDYLMAARIAELSAERAKEAGINAVVIPVLPFGCWDSFAGAPGCIALRPDTFRLVLRDILETLVAQGSRRVIVVNGHYGNVEPIYEITNGIYERTGIIIPSLYLWKTAFAILEKVIGREDTMASIGHGANGLASVAMHLFPDYVRPDLAVAPQPRLPVMGLPVTGGATALFRGLEVDIPVSVRETSVNGAMGGDMRMCSPETGAAITEELVTTLAELARHLTEQTS